MDEELSAEGETSRGAGPSVDFRTREIRDSRAFHAIVCFVFATVAALFAGAGWPLGAMLAMPPAGWAAYRMVAGSVRLRISEDGVEDRSFWYSAGFIPWSEILEVRSGPWGAVEIELRDEAAFWERLGPLRQLPRVKLRLFYGLGPAAIVPWGLAGSRSGIVEAMQEALDTHALRSLVGNERLESPTQEAPVRSGASHQRPRDVGLLRFDVFGRLVGILREGGRWRALYVGREGRHRDAPEIVIPPDLDESELARFLGDLFHESARPDRAHVVRLDPGASPQTRRSKASPEAPDP